MTNHMRSLFLTLSAIVILWGGLPMVFLGDSLPSLATTVIGIPGLSAQDYDEPEEPTYPEDPNPTEPSEPEEPVEEDPEY